MKVHQTAAGRLCWCAWCAPRLTAFRIVRADLSAQADEIDADYFRRRTAARADAIAAGEYCGRLLVPLGLRNGRRVEHVQPSRVRMIWFSRWRKPKRPDPSQPLEAQLAQLREHLQVLERQQYQLAQNLADALQDSQFIAQQISARLLNVPKAQRWWYGE